MNVLLEKNLKQAQAASRILADASHARRRRFLRALAGALVKHSQEIIKANERDLKKFRHSALADRLQFDQARIKSTADSLLVVAALADPLGNLLASRKLNSNLRLVKKTVPLGVVGIIYESRPNVTIDVVGLCIKAGNAVVLKGGQESQVTNACLVNLIKRVLKTCGLPEGAVYLLDANQRSLVRDLLKADKYVDVIIPRGGSKLIQFVRANSLIPVIATGAGVCHTYIDATAKIGLALDIVYHAKTSRPTVCNALDTLLIHRKAAKASARQFAQKFQNSGVTVYADAVGYKLLRQAGYHHLKKARPGDYGREFLSLAMALKIVPNVAAATAHINHYGSKHSEAIIAEDKSVVARFFREVDAGCVYANASTRLTDGGQFGLGAEVGISTQKLHGRGPLGAQELTTYKWLAFPSDNRYSGIYE